MSGMDTEKTLLQEIEKWAARLNKELSNIEPYGPKGHEFLKNIKAYADDSNHFLEKEDLVRAFEAIVWAWAWLEIGKDLEFLKSEYVNLR